MRIPVLFLASAALLATSCSDKKDATKPGEATEITAAPVPPPANGDWTTVVTKTAEGGFMMGNPNAKVKLIEIGALTCPHCREFDEAAVPELVEKYVKAGHVSWEFRPYLLNGLDVPANLVAACNGPNTFFPLMRAMYKDQADWIGKIQAAPQEQVQQAMSTQQYGELARLAGLQDWGAARGVPRAKSDQCLKDQKTIEQLVQHTVEVPSQYPDFKGTPSFIIDGEMFSPEGGAPLWDQLKAELNERIG